jgi:hypothetical protein
MDFAWGVTAFCDDIVRCDSRLLREIHTMVSGLFGSMTIWDSCVEKARETIISSDRTLVRYDGIIHVLTGTEIERVLIHRILLPILIKWGFDGQLANGSWENWKLMASVVVDSDVPVLRNFSTGDCRILRDKVTGNVSLQTINPHISIKWLACTHMSELEMKQLYIIPAHLPVVDIPVINPPPDNLQITFDTISIIRYSENYKDLAKLCTAAVDTYVSDERLVMMLQRPKLDIISGIAKYLLSVALPERGLFVPNNEYFRRNILYCGVCHHATIWPFISRQQLTVTDTIDFEKYISDLIARYNFWELSATMITNANLVAECYSDVCVDYPNNQLAAFIPPLFSQNPQKWTQKNNLQHNLMEYIIQKHPNMNLSNDVSEQNDTICSNLRSVCSPNGFLKHDVGTLDVTVLKLTGKLRQETENDHCLVSCFLHGLAQQLSPQAMNAQQLNNQKRHVLIQDYLRVYCAEQFEHLSAFLSHRHNYHDCLNVNRFLCAVWQDSSEMSGELVLTLLSSMFNTIIQVVSQTQCLEYVPGVILPHSSIPLLVGDFPLRTVVLMQFADGQFCATTVGTPVDYKIFQDKFQIDNIVGANFTRHVFSNSN